MKLFKTLSNGLNMKSKKLSATIIGAAMAGASSTAYAQGGIADIANSVTEQTQELPNVITVIAYLGGAVLAFGGVLSVKQHVDNPQQKPLREGLVRLIAGALLLAAPATFEALRESVGLNDGSNGLTNQQFNDIQF
tara:strand:+ start:1388 stop:1795 length:408 start_codon:yes stop_codon:yes gene_type:complete